MDDLDIPRLECKRCGHQWIPRSTLLPKVCPKCNSPYWDKERGWYKKMKQKKEDEKKKKADDIEDLTELSSDLRGQ